MLLEFMGATSPSPSFAVSSVCMTLTVLPAPYSQECGYLLLGVFPSLLSVPNTKLSHKTKVTGSLF